MRAGREREGRGDADWSRSWAVIASYFTDKTLVSQQIDSFNEFVNNTMQELVDEGQSLILDQNMQHTGRTGDRKSVV